MCSTSMCSVMGGMSLPHARGPVMLNLFMCVIVLAPNVLCHGNEPKSNYVYSYSVNISEESKPDIPFKTLVGQVLVVPYVYSSPHPHISFVLAGEKLLHIRMTLKDSIDNNEEVRLEAVAEFDAEGMLKQLHVPENLATKTSEFSLFKGMVNLFVVHPNFESGFETGAAGTCRVSYATVQTSSSEHLSVDKFFSSCSPVQKPLDTWRYSLIPTSKVHSTRELRVRYRFHTHKGDLLQAIAYEKQTYDSVSGTHLNQLNIVAWQDLQLVKVADGEPENIPPTMNLSEMAKQLTGSENMTVHLAPAFPLEHDLEACTLNVHLYNSDVNVKEKFITIEQVRNVIENARNALHSEHLGTLRPLHTVLQLTRFLRCLPNHSSAVDLLTFASMLSPPATEAKMLHRQGRSWRDQLVSVLIGCGTPTCVTVVLQRLEALTEVALVEKTETIGLPQEVVIAREMLFSKLWPALTHLRQPTFHTYGRLLKCCQPVADWSHQTVCLSALLNLWPQLYEEHLELRNELIGITEKQLLISSTNTARQQEEDRFKLNSRLLFGLMAVEKLKAIELFDLVLQIIKNSEHAYPPVRAAAVRTLASIWTADKDIMFSNTIRFNIKTMNLRSLLRDQLLNIPSDSEDDLLLGIELFHALVTLDPCAQVISDLLRQLGSQKRWPLVRACRLLVRQSCVAEQLPASVCNCLGENVSVGSVEFQSCLLGDAGGWAGLAGGNGSDVGYNTFVHGDLFNVNGSFIVEYSIQLVNGPDKELRTFNLLISLLNAEGESKLFEFDVSAKGLETFAGSFGLGVHPKKPVQNEGAWVSLGLMEFDTILPPWLIFSGGMSDLLHLLWHAPSHPTPVLQILRPLIDERQYSAFAAGFVLGLDSLAVVSVEVSGAMETSVWSQSGRSLVRTRIGMAGEVYARILGKSEGLTATDPRFIVKGVGGEGNLDFVSHVNVRDLPDGICLSMNRPSDLELLVWENTKPLVSCIPSKWNQYEYRDPNNHAEYKVTHRVVNPGVSYDLGRNNTERCNQMSVSSLW
ncbi:microsomal triglyceride transfer protein large subunit [Clonorchis sinensis]|uniref:Microsomal triglyceride transfer protein large subunit n=1 Tax=Clonorchis sinensis TaxID=79923 RepID=H2KTI2_CLOSI|nr:microsomal triglyceride transfer protein large subunit [Clonorchis sinensis]